MADKDIMLSVLLICYNHAAYLEQALDSVIQQKTDFPMEIIIHDDASTDDSQQIIRRYAQQYPELIRPILQTENKAQKGVPIRRTYMDPMIRGKYIALCETDDYWLDPDKVQKQVDFLEQNPQYAACTHNCLLVDKNGDELPPDMQLYRPYVAHTATLHRMALSGMFPGQTASVLLRREAYNALDEAQLRQLYSLRIPTGDKRLFLTLLLWGDIYCMEQTMSAHRVVRTGGGSWTARNHNKNLSFARHAAAVDMAKYVKEVWGRPFPNDYIVFHTALACIGKAIKSPTPENKQVYARLKAEYGGFFGLCGNLIRMALRGLPLRSAFQKEVHRYDAK